MSDEKIDDGGAAFPSLREYTTADGWVSRADGMSLRDWYAGMALQGMMSRDDFTIDIDKEVHGLQRAQVCLLMADAMIAARKADK